MHTIRMVTIQSLKTDGLLFLHTNIPFAGKKHIDRKHTNDKKEGIWMEITHRDCNHRAGEHRKKVNGADKTVLSIAFF